MGVMLITYSWHGDLVTKNINGVRLAGHCSWQICLFFGLTTARWSGCLLLKKPANCLNIFRDNIQDRQLRGKFLNGHRDEYGRKLTKNERTKTPVASCFGHCPDNTPCVPGGRRFLAWLVAEDHDGFTA